jgi:hypothetical protein
MGRPLVNAGLGLEAFKNVNVRLCCGAPELYTISPDRFKNDFIDEKFIGDGEFRPASKEPFSKLMKN